MDSAMFLGNACQSGLVPALVRAPLPAIQSSLGLKQFLPFPLDSSPALNLLPRFSSMDPVQEAILHHTLGLPASSKKKYVACNVCQLRFNSQSQALSHYKGTKHARKLKSLDVPKCKQRISAMTRENCMKEPSKSPSPSTPLQNGYHRKDAASSAAQTGLDSELQTTSAAENGTRPPELEVEVEPEPENGTETEEEKALRLLYCSLCKVAVNSPSQLEAHNSGTKHKTMLEARSGSGSIKSFPRPGVKNKQTIPASAGATGLQNKTFHCETCDVHVNSETQLKQHISSRRHKDRAAGKPAKPKYSPYNKTQRGQSKQQTAKLSLGKDLCQPLMPACQIMSSHLAAVAAATAVTAVGPSFPLRASHNPALFQSQALLRPAPGPIRTTHTPVLFAPY